jgi:riboflavin kinase/FMN adenylyltransferase
VEAAHGLLGRPYRLSGSVARGERRGRELGFPTANLDSPNEILPGRGVYAGWALLPGDAERRAAVINVGHRPTFGPGHLRVEVHLLDFEEDLYGRELDVDFVGRLRGERSFPSPEALVEQIHLDVASARALLGPRPSARVDALE